MRRLIVITALFVVAISTAMAQENNTEAVAQEENQEVIVYENTDIYSPKKYKFQAHLNIGGYVFMNAKEKFGWHLRVDLGALISDRVFVGGEITALANKFKPRNPLSISRLDVLIAPNVKYYPRCKPGVAPYLSFSVFPTVDSNNNIGVYLNAGGGIDIKRFNISLGYSLLSYTEKNLLEVKSNKFVNALYIQLGVRL